MDLRAPELILMQFIDTSSYTLMKTQLAILRPVEVSIFANLLIISHTFIHCQPYFIISYNFLSVVHKCS